MSRSSERMIEFPEYEQRPVDRALQEMRLKGRMDMGRVGPLQVESYPQVEDGEEASYLDPSSRQAEDTITPRFVRRLVQTLHSLTNNTHPTS